MRTNGEQFYEAELYRLQGELLLAPAGQGQCPPGPSEAAAERSMQQGLDIARHQQAKSLELRAALSLARLGQRQGKRDEAHELLAPIYGWFTEGLTLLTCRRRKPSWRNSHELEHGEAGAYAASASSSTSMAGSHCLIAQGFSFCDCTYTRALVLCQQLGETAPHFRVLRDLWNCALSQGKLLASRKL